MKTGPKFRTVIFLSILALTTLSSCGANMKTVEKTLAEAKELNANSYLGGMQYLQLSNLTEEQNKENSIDYPATKEWIYEESIEGLYSLYPYKNGEIRLTEISFYSNDYSVFNITIGDHVEDVIQILKDRDYKIVQSSYMFTGTNTKVLQKFDIIIYLETNIGSYNISTITITVDRHVPSGIRF